jgi:hypothetical protein
VVDVASVSRTLAVIVREAAVGVAKRTKARAAGSGASSPLSPAEVSPPQYRPANRTVEPDGRASVDRLELKVELSLSTSV